jgi:Flp pilus assembly pilin Flp
MFSKFKNKHAMSGATMVEYVLIVALVAIVVAASFSDLATALIAKIADVVAAL